MAAPKRTKFQREENYVQITELYLRGKTQYEIAALLEISQSQVNYDLKVIQRQWRESTTMNLDEAKAKELARLDELERTFWAAWESSKTERTQARQEKNNAGATVKASMTKEQRDGNPAFLAGVMGCIEQRCKLLGLYAATKTQNLNVDLSTLTDEQLDRLDNGEPVEQVLKRG